MSKEEEEALTVADDKTVPGLVRDIEAEIDFKPYLDAVNAGSDRTRSTVYVLLTMVAIAFTSYRNTTNPDWLDSRLSKFQMAAACAKENPSISSNADIDLGTLTPRCADAVTYAKNFLFSGNNDPLLVRKEFSAEIGDQITALMKLRTEALSLRLPFVGTVIDVNDIGLITGAFLAFILYILYVVIDGEIHGLNRAMVRASNAKTREKQKENLELLLMTQVLAQKKGPTYVVLLMLIFAVSIHALILRNDLNTFYVAVELEGRFWALVETGVDIGFFVAVAVFCVRVWISQLRLDKDIDKLSTAVLSYS